MTAVTWCQDSVTAEKQSAHKTGVSKLSQILGYGRKLGRAAKAGSPSPHPLGNGMNLTRAVALSAVKHGRSSLHHCHPVLPTSLPRTKILECKIREVGWEQQYPKNMGNCLQLILTIAQSHVKELYYTISYITPNLNLILLHCIWLIPNYSCHLGGKMSPFK